MSYLNRKVKSIMLSGLLSMGIVTANYVAFNKEVVLIVYGQEIEVNSFQPDVQGVLEENEINYDENHIISEDLDASLKNGMKIEVKQVEKKTITETEDIPYDTVIKKDNSLLKGKIEVSQKGKKGTKELIYDAIYQNGKLVSKTLVEENTIEKVTEIQLEANTYKELDKLIDVYNDAPRDVMQRLKEDNEQDVLLNIAKMDTLLRMMFGEFSIDRNEENNKVYIFINLPMEMKAVYN
ncbi:hypothetical protein SDC9_112663 [bioreactor metagenome]|uniref:G5 domain-containing protein n=1 Tax=bioreactor metagenome TaxID=1076179 RepID=A0A645BKN7_9ZZZZ